VLPLITNKLPELSELCRRCAVRRLDLFGSAAGGAFDPARSDLDFVVEFLPVVRGGFDDVYFRLLEGLGHIFGRNVDLIESDSISNPYFRRSVDATKVPVYAAA
jgi:predicted nucleotidyltransferase